jgi:hypothetical protein
MLWLPTEFLPRAGGVGNQNRRIARPAWTDMHRHVAIGDTAHAIDDLAHRPAVAGAEVERRTRRPVGQRAQRRDMRRRQVGDVNVIAHARAVWGRIIIAEDGEAVVGPRRGVEDERYRVRFRNVALTDVAVGVGTRRVEIAQRREGQRKGWRIRAACAHRPSCWRRTD